jgi:hypothetical protein
VRKNELDKVRGILGVFVAAREEHEVVMNTTQVRQDNTPTMVEAIAQIPLIRRDTVRKLKLRRGPRNTTAKEGTWLVFTLAVGVVLLFVLPFVV